ncbi:MAG: PepSY domain-containing protein [Steroidobacteraceae bacterium]|nr:PepSY domain-containing protein [Steroidobacteraceae bacterium]
MLMRIGRPLALVTILLLAASAAGAQEFIIERRPPARHQFEAQGVSLDQAVQMVQRRYGARAVKAETVRQGERRVHKIRLLSAEGKVWNVIVDAQTGAER